MDNRTSNDDVIERYCYDNLDGNCDKYGGLYSWLEMMDYSPGDTGMVGITQGICPDGWHVPTPREWNTLIDYLGGASAAGSMLKATGTLEDGDGLWYAPNTGATNETGFTALPEGSVQNDEDKPAELNDLGKVAAFWNSGRDESGEDSAGGTYVMYNNASGITPAVP